MTEKVTLDRVIAFLRIFLMVACCWPISPNMTKFQRLLRRALRYFCCANSIIFIIAAVWTICHQNNYMLLIKVGCELSAVLQVILQLVLFAMQDKRFEFLVSEMEDYYQRAQKFEKEIFQYYVDKCKLFYGIIFCWLIMTALSMMATPLFTPQTFPCQTEYPFDIHYQPLKTIILVHHLFTIYQSMTQVSANSFPALFLWFVAARFHILSVRFRTMTNMKELIKCTQEHNILLRYAKEVSLAIRYVALLVVTFSIGAVIFGYLTFISRESWLVKATYFLITFGAFIELFMFAWPADYVMSMSTDIASAVYDSLWYNDDLVMQKLLTNVIIRSQRPVTVSVPCALPSLCLSYYASYLSTVFSYMAAVRLLMEEN
ncbi:uncharacterized protein [Anoplolepis gracilipes]|uniref:uncharacterized protein n=1 Tax=Anoplolepis gracilipes TaxID=354296 RepID=UPI003BA171A1